LFDLNFPLQGFDEIQVIICIFERVKQGSLLELEKLVLNGLRFTSSMFVLLFCRNRLIALRRIHGDALARSAHAINVFVVELLVLAKKV